MGRLRVGYADQMGMSPEAKDAHNKEYSSTDAVVQLASARTPEQIAADVQLTRAVQRFLVDLTVVGTINDFREADTISEYAVAAIFAIPGLGQADKIRHASNFRKAYIAAKEAGDLHTAKELLNLAREAQRSPSRLSQLAVAEAKVNRIKTAQSRLRDTVSDIERVVTYKGRAAEGERALAEALERFADTGQKVGELRPSDHIQKAREQLSRIKATKRAVRNSTMPDKQILLDRLKT